MPIEIKELHIKVTVNAAPPSGGQSTAPSAPAASSGEDKDAIVAECVEQVLQILSAKTER